MHVTSADLRVIITWELELLESFHHSAHLLSSLSFTESRSEGHPSYAEGHACGHASLQSLIWPSSFPKWRKSGGACSMALAPTTSPAFKANFNLTARTGELVLRPTRSEDVTGSLFHFCFTLDAVLTCTPTLLLRIAFTAHVTPWVFRHG